MNMQPIEKDLRESLRENVPVGYPLEPRADITKSVRTRRIRMIAVPGLSLAVLSFISVWAVGSFIGSNATPADPSPVQPVSSETADEHVTKAEQLEPTSEPSTIASGDESGKSWSLRTYVAQVGTDEALCLNWSFDGASTGFDCFGGLLSGPSGSHDVQLLRFTGSGHTAVFGVATEQVAAVELVLDSGATTSGEVYDAPESFEANLNFFVTFSAKDADNKLIARSSSGEILEERKTE